MVVQLLLQAHLVSHDNEPDWAHASTKALVMSLTSINTVYEVHGSGRAEDVIAAAVAKQNHDSLADRTSAMQWAVMCRSQAPGLKNTSVEDTTPQMAKAAMEALAKILARYNERPDVIASCPTARSLKKARCSKAGSAADDDGYEDLGLMIGKLTSRTIENLLTKSTEKFWEIHRLHLNEFLPRHAGITDNQLRNPFIYTGSILPLPDPTTQSDASKPEGETGVAVDWRLPMTAEAHNALGARLVADFKRATRIHPNPEKWKSCRADPKTLYGLRQALAFWFQPEVRALHMATLEPGAFEELESNVLSGNTYDQELLDVVNMAPRIYFVSMLRSCREAVSAKLRDTVTQHSAAADEAASKARARVRAGNKNQTNWKHEKHVKSP